MGIFTTIKSWFTRKETTTITELSAPTIRIDTSSDDRTKDIYTPSRPTSTTTTTGSGRRATTTTITYPTPTPTPTPTPSPVLAQPKVPTQKRLEAPTETKKGIFVRARERREERKRPSYISETGERVYTPIGEVLDKPEKTKLKDQFKVRREGVIEMKEAGLGFFKRIGRTSPFKIPEAKLIAYGFLATPRGIVATIPKMPKPIGVRFTGVSQKIKGSILETKIAFKTTTGYKGIATGTTKIVGRVKQITAGRTLVKGGMGKYAYRLPSGKIKIFKPTIKQFMAVEKSITGGGKVQLIKDFRAFKLSITKPASLGVSIGKVAVVGRKGKPTTSVYKSIQAGIKTRSKITELAGISATTKGGAYSWGRIKDVSSFQTKIKIGKIAGPKGSFYKTFQSVQSLKSIQATQSGIRAAVSTIKPTSIVKTFTTTKPLISFGGISLVSAKPTVKQMFKSPTITTKEIQVTTLKPIVSVGPLIKEETKQEDIQKYKSGLGLGSVVSQAPIQTPAQTPKIFQTPIVTPTPTQIIKTVPIQRLAPTTTTPIIPFIPTPIIPRFPMIPPLKFPFPSVDRGKGAGVLLGGIGSRYTPSFKAFVSEIKGKKPTKTKFTGLELRPIPSGFKWIKKRKKKWGWGVT